jgi:hypothetical protein
LQLLVKIAKAEAEEAPIVSTAGTRCTSVPESPEAIRGFQCGRNHSPNMQTYLGYPVYSVHVVVETSASCSRWLAAASLYHAVFHAWYPACTRPKPFRSRPIVIKISIEIKCSQPSCKDAARLDHVEEVGCLAHHIGRRRAGSN